MKKVAVFSVLLIAGLVLSQFLPAMASDADGPVEHGIRMLTMSCNPTEEGSPTGR